MPKINYYEDVKVLKKPLKQRLKSILIFCLILITIMGCFGIAFFLSEALTVGNLGAFVVYGDTKLKVDKSIMYAVTLGEYANKEEAEKVALGATIQGASGYVWEDNKYYVIGNIYSSYDDAMKVMENLKESKYNTAIKEIVFPKLAIDFEMYENSDMEVVKNSLKIIDDIYKLLYDYSIKYDKGDVSHLAVSSGLSSCRGEVKSMIVKVQNLLNKEMSSLSKIQLALIKCDEILDQTILKAIDNSSTNYSIKYAIACVVRIKYELYLELA